MFGRSDQLLTLDISPTTWDKGMTNVEGNIAGFLHNLTLSPAAERRTRPFLGIDECLNRREIEQLAQMLLQRGLVDSSAALWYETRERDGVIVGSFAGGIAKDSAFRGPDSLITDIGVPVKHGSWSDHRVLQMLVVHFTSYDNLILLSENTRNNADGLRSILREVVGPSLKDRSDVLSLTALFKKGKTSIDQYTGDVTSFFERGHYQSGYVEILL